MSPIVSKGFRNDCKSESVDGANVWWILRADFSSFEGFMGDFRKKNILQTDFERKKHATKFLEKQYPALKKLLLMTYNVEKNLTTLYVGQKISNSRGLGKNCYLKITHTPLPHKRPMVMSTI